MLSTILLVLAVSSHYGFALTRIQTRGRVPGVSPRDLHNFLATADNWPRIVASSWAVEGASNRPLVQGDVVDEIFGLPPVLPLRVKWTCEKANSEYGLLDVFSASGLSGVAINARMLFMVAADDSGGSIVDLEMSFEPISPIAMLALPILQLDNALALKVLLPRALASPQSALDRFRELMGVLYGVAGVAHLADLSGPNLLLGRAGVPAFSELPLEAQALAIAWCAAGPLAAALALTNFADAGLVIYGAVEVAGAASVLATSGDQAALVGALGVQVAVAASWLYSMAQGQ